MSDIISAIQVFDHIATSWIKLEDLCPIRELVDQLLVVSYGTEISKTILDTKVVFALVSEFTAEITLSKHAPWTDSVYRLTATADPDVDWIDSVVRVNMRGSTILGTFVKRDGPNVLLKNARFYEEKLFHPAVWLQYTSLRLPTSEELKKWLIRNRELSQ